MGKSHPVWVRGLKLYGLLLTVAKFGKSHPVWVRGLKFTCFTFVKHSEQVAPRVGAWIEIICYQEIYSCLGSRTPCGCVD